MTMRLPQPQKKKMFTLYLLLNDHHRNVTGNAVKTKYYDTHDEFHRKFDTLCKQGLLKEALEILHVMDYRVNTYLYQSILHGCIEKGALPEGKVVHAHMNMRGFMSDNFLVNTLIDMYAKCGSLKDSRKLFDEMPKRTLFSWTMMIAACRRHGFFKEALRLFDQMQSAGTEPDGFVFATALQACGKILGQEKGKIMHRQIIERGLDSDIVIGNALIDMYEKCGSLENARYLFDKMEKRNAVSWTTMIGGYVRIGQFDEALELFRNMRLLCINPDAMTLASILAACESLEQGKEIHEEIIRNGFQSNVFVGSSLVDMYAKCGRIKRARHVFDKMPKRNTVSWTVMISGCVRNGYANEALRLFHRMQLEGITPDSKTFASVLPACANLSDMQLGTNIHEQIIRSGVQGNLAVSSALVDMYAKCGNVAKARDLFDKMSCRDVASWNTIVAAYSRNGPFEEALTLFCQMYQADIQPTGFSFACVLPACTKLTSVEKGMEIHEKIITSGFHSNSFVENALVDMYAKCGRIDHAQKLFGRMHEHNLISWNTMIGGYAMRGHGNEALKLFEQMKKSGVNPDHATFNFILFVCSNAGLVEAGRQYFDCMIQHNHITPTMEHYCYMVDLLVHAGHPDEAEDLIKKNAVEPDAKLWHCLLGVCRINDNIDLEEHVAEHLLDLDSKDAASHV
ncbi:pentatricopeptide repeat-containing protein At3g03580 [Cryptomeria japonica]|uniref:pentatricopeptide repeat-containing protein At3g03580 n=1 Tax=Cryptomeria japonica TaxID=3369 RepID=UPI0027DA2B68|nr:pentatricopeptide repeat-containing protein At3g03580 [Cryptomeria japonica]